MPTPSPHVPLPLPSRAPLLRPPPMPDGSKLLPYGNTFRLSREGSVPAPLTCIKNAPPTPSPVAQDPLPLSSRTPLLRLPPMPDDQSPTPYDCLYCLPRGGPAITLAVARARIAPPMPSPAAAVAHSARSAKCLRYSPACIATTFCRPAVAAQRSSPATNAPPGCPAVCVSALAHILCSCPVADVLRHGRLVDVAIMHPVGVASTPSTWPLLLPVQLSLLQVPPWPDDPRALADDEVFSPTRGRSLPSLAVVCAMAIPPLLPDIATLPMSVVPTGAPDSALGAILDAIASMCTRFRRRVKWMRRRFQVF
ncbi:hypothetical protein AX14_008340 [Amanita brunnescens Koide BX004]|nr:hypothetical protein AX14_008340 [Amanita brunnescens Koide BX004]